MTVRVQTDDFNIGAEIEAMTSEHTDLGAVVSFTGIVRGGNGADQISAMTLEHYPGMTEAELAHIEAQARERWPLSASLIVHRYGRLEPGQNIVLVITASAHRQAAFEAASFLMDYLKTSAPFWKSEERLDGAKSWVEEKQSDNAALERWNV
ncbi:MAG: molybdenum cofactor biosynthesis protein MoaE [Hyphomicrobiales bacterium]|nr:molybdenum cofactor biosynthesis protein MoaE [Hyphomicrobiales bacterium]